MNLEVSYVVIFAAITAAVFAVASLFEKTPSVTVTSIRRGDSSHWLSRLLSGFRRDEAAERKDATRLMLLQAGYEAPDAVQTFQATRAALAIGLPALMLALVPLIKPDLATGIVV